MDAKINKKFDYCECNKFLMWNFRRL